MGKVIRFIDDFSGKELPDGEGETLSYSLGEAYYEIDLGSDSRAKLEKLLQPWIDKSIEVEPPQPEPVVRRGRGPAKATTRTQVPGEGPDYLAAVRRWAAANGIEVAARGRVAQSVKDQYEAANKL